MSLDHYLTTEPEDRQDALTPEEPEGCADCGQAVCDCDTRCPLCGERYRSAVEYNMGICCECRQDEVESLRDEVA